MGILVKPARKLMTVDEFFDFVHRPENDARCFDLVRGEVIEVSRPNRPHGMICANGLFILMNYARKTTRFYVTGDTGVVLERRPDTVRGPDIAVWDDVQRFEDLPKKWGNTQPRVAVEVLSPNDRPDYVHNKITDYLNNNVDMVWVLDPPTRTLTVHRPGVEPVIRTEKDWLTGNDVLPGFRCKVAEFFRKPQPPARKHRTKRKK